LREEGEGERRGEQVKDNSFVRSFIRCSSGGDRIAVPVFVLLGNLRFNRGIKRKTPRGLSAPRRVPYATECVFKRGGGRDMRCQGGKDGCDSAIVSTIPIIALLRAAGFAETAMVNDCEHFAFNVLPYNLNLDSDNARFSNLRFQIINETMATDISRNRIYLILVVQSRMHLMQTRL